MDFREIIIKDAMQKTDAIQKVVHKVNLHQQPSDFVYWQSQSPLTRLATLEQIRREYHLWKYRAEPRLQRVCSIVKR
jgi:hypothetical protein